MKKVSVKKLLGIVAITVALIVVIALTLLYVGYAERLNFAKELDIKEQMTEIINRQPEFDIQTTKGTIRIKLYNKTPIHLKNFEKLVKENFYDSLLFHRVINGFMIQTGDPYTKDSSKVDMYGQGGTEYTLPAEFIPEYTHKKGAIAAARRGDRANPKKSSSGSQFYIVQNEENCMHLDGQYTVFGETIEGFDVIDKIAQVATDRYDRPYEDIRIITIKPVKIDVIEAVDSLASKAGIDSLSEKLGLDSLAKKVGIDSIGKEDLEKIQEGVDKLKEATKGIDKKDAIREIKKIDIQKIKKIDEKLKK